VPPCRGQCYLIALSGGRPQPPSSGGKDSRWRKATFERELSATETLLFGVGGGSEWSFAYDGGEFAVQFKADGFNHFNCPTYPAHSHYTVDGDKIYIDWQKYGEYDMVVDVAAKTMSGSTKGKPEDWRKVLPAGACRLARSIHVDQHTYTLPHINYRTQQHHIKTSDASCRGHM
jgi:hypothetical protein